MFWWRRTVTAQLQAFGSMVEVGDCYCSSLQGNKEWKKIPTRERVREKKDSFPERDIETNKVWQRNSRKQKERRRKEKWDGKDCKRKILLVTGNHTIEPNLMQGLYVTIFFFLFSSLGYHPSQMVCQERTRSSSFRGPQIPWFPPRFDREQWTLSSSPGNNSSFPPLNVSLKPLLQLFS